MIWEKIKKLASKPFFWPMVGALATVITALIMLIIYLGEIVRFVGWVLKKVWGILNQPVPIYDVLVIFVLILIVFLLIKLRKLRLNEKEMFILGILDERELGLNLLFKVYKQRFDAESRTMSNCLVTIKQLEKKKLIEGEVFTGGTKDIQDEMFKLTKKGQKRFKKLDSVIKKKAEDIYNKLLATPKIKFERQKLERIEPNKEIIFILELLAKQQNRSMRNTALRDYYFENFSNKKVIDFNIVWNRLQIGDLITEYRGSPGHGRSYIYSITDRGVEYLRTYKENKF